jgi:hypothetical protein
VRWQSLFIGGFLAVQLAVPAHYYLARADKHDERFAWRMFSSMRFLKCSAEFSAHADTPRRIVIDRFFHEAWTEVAERGRLSVIERMGAKLCAERCADAGDRRCALRDDETLAIAVRCTGVDRTTEIYQSADFCRTPTLEPEAAAP